MFSLRRQIPNNFLILKTYTVIPLFIYPRQKNTVAAES